MIHGKPRRILYYCQSLVGVGHLACSLRVVERLLVHAEVDLIQGGLDVAREIEHPRYRNLRQTTLLHDEESGAFFDPGGTRSVEAIWETREREIDAFLRPPYDAVVIEFYPFGRRRFKPEIMHLLRAVRAHSGPVPVFTSVREVLVPRAVENERRMIESVRKHIHTVFVRGDPAIVRFDETFSLASQIADKLFYTGYIAPAPLRDPPVRTNQILVSQGGGNVGRELLEAALAVAPRFPAHRFVLAAGARAAPPELDALRARVRSSNVEIHPFLADFQRRLAASALSISMGGDNTLMDVVTTRTPALAWPYQDNPEQGFRVRKFAEKGLVHELGTGDFAPERFEARIQQALATPYPRQPVNTDGARITCERILGVLDALAEERMRVARATSKARSASAGPVSTFPAGAGPSHGD